MELAHRCSPGSSLCNGGGREPPTKITWSEACGRASRFLPIGEDNPTRQGADRAHWDRRRALGALNCLPGPCRVRERSRPCRRLAHDPAIRAPIPPPSRPPQRFRTSTVIEALLGRLPRRKPALPYRPTRKCLVWPASGPSIRLGTSMAVLSCWSRSSTESPPTPPSAPGRRRSFVWATLSTAVRIPPGSSTTSCALPRPG